MWILYLESVYLQYLQITSKTTTSTDYLLLQGSAGYDYGFTYNRTIIIKVYYKGESTFSKFIYVHVSYFWFGSIRFGHPGFTNKYLSYFNPEKKIGSHWISEIPKITRAKVDLWSTTFYEHRKYMSYLSYVFNCWSNIIFNENSNCLLHSYFL